MIPTSVVEVHMFHNSTTSSKYASVKDSLGVVCLYLKF